MDARDYRRRGVADSHRPCDPWVLRHRGSYRCNGDRPYAEPRPAGPPNPQDGSARGVYWDDTQRTGPTNETYELAKELDQRKKTYDDLLKYDPAGAEAYLKKHQEELEASAYTNQILLELGALRARMNYLDSKRGVQEIPEKAQREAEAKALRERELELTSGIREFKKRVDEALKEGRANRSATP